MNSRNGGEQRSGATRPAVGGIPFESQRCRRGLRPAVRVEELPADLGCPRDDQRHLRGRLGNAGETGEPAGVVPRVKECINSIADAEPDPALVVGRLTTEEATGSEEKRDGARETGRRAARVRSTTRTSTRRGSPGSSASSGGEAQARP